MNTKKKIKRAYNTATIIFLLLLIAYAVSRFVHIGNIEYTDDAQVQRHITPINNRVPGFIREIRFEEYQQVKRGDTLVIIEDAEYLLQLAQAEANLRSTKHGSTAVTASMQTTSSNVNVASATIEEAKVEMENAKTDLDRYTALLQKDVVTRQEYDNVKARYDRARARYEQASASRTSTSLLKQEQAQRLSQNTQTESVAEAQVRLARLNLSYTAVIATANGVIGRKDIHVGQLVGAGQLLARIIDAENVWIIANYRETQLQHIKVGNKVTFTADAIPDVEYTGEVESLSPATGSAYSMVPADNATGNFVKVEQRVPVRIRISKDNDPKDVARLLAGLNVETKVEF